MAEVKEIVEDENKIDTVIGDDILFKGTLKFTGSLKIKGVVEGKIQSTGTLIVGREATVSADINSREVDISGTVNGKIQAAQKIELYKKSRVSADIISPELIIDSGSIFNGTCIMPEKK